MELAAVVFPDTVPSERLCIPLVPVFAPLVHLQPVENDPGLASACGPICTDLERQSLCRLLVPAPLGEDRERFLRLVTDLRQRRDDYTAQLGYLALAGISAASGKKAETKSSIVGSLLAGHGIRNAAADRRQMLLWQSRLLLKLAEMQAADQEELQRQIQRIREKERGLFAGLRDEEEYSFVVAEGIAGLGPDAGALRQQRKAWARLLLLGETGGPGISILLSGDRDGIDLLADQYEKGTGRRPADLGYLLLPATFPEGEDYSDRVRRFRAGAGALLARLRDSLHGAAEGDAGCGLSSAEEKDWADLLARFFPVEECGRTRLALSACPGRSIRQLVAETFSPEELALSPPPEAGPARGTVLGILEE